MTQVTVVNLDDSMTSCIHSLENYAMQKVLNNIYYDNVMSPPMTILLL